MKGPDRVHPLMTTAFSLSLLLGLWHREWYSRISQEEGFFEYRDQTLGKLETVVHKDRGNGYIYQYILWLSLVSEYQAVKTLVPGEPTQLGFIRNMLVPGKLTWNNHQETKFKSFPDLKGA